MVQIYDVGNSSRFLIFKNLLNSDLKQFSSMTNKTIFRPFILVCLASWRKVISGHPIFNELRGFVAQFFLNYFPEKHGNIISELPSIFFGIYFFLEDFRTVLLLQTWLRANFGQTQFSAQRAE